MLALVIVLALLVAPVCAPICAARGCSAGAAKEQCHETAGKGAVEFVTSSKACETADFSAVLKKADERALFSREPRSDAAFAPIRDTQERGANSFQLSPERRGVHLVPLESPGSLLLGAILRI
jgi:hypothetical protein